MKELEEKIRKEGRVLPGTILKVDSFLNHLVDVALFSEMGKRFAEEFKAESITKVLTVEASGIALASIAAQFFPNSPRVLYAKKSRALNQDSNVYSTPVFSFTHNKQYLMTVDKQYLLPTDRILIIDDFLANGGAVNGLLRLCEQAGATVCGIGIAIEKGFMGGGDRFRSEGHHLCSLAVVDAMNDGEIVFRQ